MKGKKLFVTNNLGPQVKILNWPRRPLLDSQEQASLTNRGGLTEAEHPTKGNKQGQQELSQVQALQSTAEKLISHTGFPTAPLVRARHL